MRRPDSESSVVLNFLPVVGAVSAAVLTYSMGVSEYWVNTSQTVFPETWRSFPPELQQITLGALKISSSCFYGATAGIAMDQTINNWEWLNKQAVRTGIVDTYYRYHPAKFLSALR